MSRQKLKRGRPRKVANDSQIVKTTLFGIYLPMSEKLVRIYPDEVEANKMNKDIWNGLVIPIDAKYKMKPVS